MGHFSSIPTAFAADTFTLSATETTGQTVINPGGTLKYNVFLKNNTSSSNGATSP